MSDNAAARLRQQAPDSQVRISFFDHRELPAVITPLRPELEPTLWCRNNRTLIRELLSKHGAVLLRGFHIGGAAGFERVLQQATSERSVQYREKATPRTHLTGTVFTSTDYDNDRTIFPHNENSYCTTWPLYVGFYCEVPPATLGATPLVDCRKVYKQIPAQVRSKLEALGVLYVRVHGHGLGMTWQQSYSVASIEELQQYCRDNAMTLTVHASGRVDLKYRRWSAIAHPITNEHVWFNHGVFFNVHALEPDLKEAFLDCYDESELPYNTYYGDGTPFEAETVRQIYDIYMNNLTRFDYCRDDVLIVDNMLVAHGRESYAGPRKICVAMTEQMVAQDFAQNHEYLKSVR